MEQHVIPGIADLAREQAECINLGFILDACEGEVAVGALEIGPQFPRRHGHRTIPICILIMTSCIFKTTLDPDRAAAQTPMDRTTGKLSARTSSIVGNRLQMA
ncbi:hypothetical protein AXW67_18855 [Bradyrhizobium neotropicale]|uniref:Uncharacterized protein n=1 Tax=Bradyrhizobium neotropicale TaxID=1497615 RepID=A0A176Z0V6_9BRAD|nr:hypothetical protein AXW67_18855 [Bradyrhizobium neotropicale]